MAPNPLSKNVDRQLFLTTVRFWPVVWVHRCARQQTPRYASLAGEVRCQRGPRTGAAGQERTLVASKSGRSTLEITGLTPLAGACPID